MFSVPPLFVIEFLHRVVDTFTEYFNSCNETSIKEHVVVVFEVRMNYDDEDGIKPYILCSCSYSLIFLEDTLLTPRCLFCH